MVIYGTALLSICLLFGLLVGKVLGMMMGVDANVGGVGIAMLCLILVCDRLRTRGRLDTPTQQGIVFWSAIYIPIVVAMAAKQNVIAALKGGPAAVVAGVGVVLVSFAMVPLLNRLGGQSDEHDAGVSESGAADIDSGDEKGTGHVR